MFQACAIGAELGLRELDLERERLGLPFEVRHDRLRVDETHGLAAAVSVLVQAEVVPAILNLHVIERAYPEAPALAIDSHDDGGTVPAAGTGEAVEADEPARLDVPGPQWILYDARAAADFVDDGDAVLHESLLCQMDTGAHHATNTNRRQ